MIGRRLRGLVLAAAVATALTGPVAPASAQDHDCTIMGPNYVEEVVDCAYFVASMIAIGDLPPN